jgi:Cu2+-containing amine oxidase
MKTITKFIFGFPMLALVSGSIAFGQFAPVTPLDSAAKRTAHPLLGGGDHVTETVEFPSGSRWHLTVNAVSKFGLVITDASFQESPTSPFLYVLFDGRLAEIFVPYHKGSPAYRDISFFNFHPLKLDPKKFESLFQLPNGAPPREIIGVDKLICREMREYLAWMKITSPEIPFEPNPFEAVRYGQEVVYFSVLGAANYNYVMEWTFRDDGTILARAGSTGPKADSLFVRPREGHVHNFTWRLDIDLNGADGNSAYWTSHSQKLSVPFVATDEKKLISVEEGLVWDPEQFNTLEIRAAGLKNGRNHPISYDLIPMRSGTARETNPEYPWTKADFWVTEYNPAQLQVVDGKTYQLLSGLPFSLTPLQSLPDYILPPKPTENKDLVIWYTGSEHHENDSRDEDFDTVPVIWTGFELEPQNLFDGTPFYPKW